MRSKRNHRPIVRPGVPRPHPLPRPLRNTDEAFGRNPVFGSLRVKQADTMTVGILIQSAGTEFTSDLLKFTDATGTRLAEFASDGIMQTTKAIKFLDGSGNVIINISPTGMADILEQAAPGTPSANYARLYVADKSGVSTLYYKDDAGVAHDLSLTLTANVVKATYKATATWDPASLLAGVTASTTITVTGAAVGDIAYATHDQIGANDVIISAHVQAADTVRVVIDNLTGGVLDIASGTLTALVWDVT